ncbi:MAG: PEGA domain-containing protein [Spirochaetales bacterium]|nr:PEGA domain-containing protein [Spirochaetales bacterium]
MNRKYVPFLFLAFIILEPLASQEAAVSRQQGGVLFLNSNPLGAQVLLNGEPVPQTTPVLLRELDAGTYNLEIRKEGYKSETGELQVSEEEPTIRNVKLEPLFFQVVYPEEEQVVFNGEIIEVSENPLLFQNGQYSFQRKAGTLYIEPVFPKQRAINALNFSIPILAGLSSLMTLNTILSPQIEGGHTLSPSVIVSWSLTLTLTVTDLFLLKERKTFLREYSLSETDDSLHSSQAEELLQRGEYMLSLGNMNEALEFYTTLIEDFPDSPLLPEALYKTAKIHSITGETDLAAGEMRLLLGRYPVPEFYDKTCQNLAVLYFIQGDFETSLFYLDAMAFVDPLFSREEVALYGSDILERWSKNVTPETME